MELRAIIASALLVAVSSIAYAADISPVKGWRVRPVALSATGSAGSIANLFEGTDASWKPVLGRSEWMAFRLPKGKEFLLTFQCKQGKTPVHAILERSVSSTDGLDGGWETVGVQLPKGKLDKFTFTRGNAEWWRIRFAFKAKEEPVEFSVSDIGIYSLDGKGRKDYWLDIGASIQAQSIRNDVFKGMVKARYPGYDPVMFNLAVGGWDSTDLVKALPGFLKAHPHAAYVCIHIGGNNVTPKRPYPGGADVLQRELVSILDMIKDAGKIPILSRLSYRAYKGAKPVPPEENGSGPYVTNIYDPLIKEYCPDFCDPTTGLGVVDGYGWFKAHQDELSSDGVHVNPKGAESWNRLWADGAGKVVYGGK